MHIDRSHGSDEQIRTAFVGQDIPRLEYELLIPGMPGHDPDDRVHATAAVARALITFLRTTCVTSHSHHSLSWASP